MGLSCYNRRIAAEGDALSPSMSGASHPRLDASRDDYSIPKDAIMTPSNIIQQLWTTIQSRKAEMPEGSYTAHLFRSGENEILKKIGEEAVEIIIAAQGEGDERVIYESADLIYHLLVLLAARGLTWEQVEAELASRFG